MRSSSKWRCPRSSEPRRMANAPAMGRGRFPPYFHDGSSATLYDAILRHEGEATVVTKAFKALAAEDQQSLIAFLKTLRAPNLRRAIDRSPVQTR